MRWSPVLVSLLAGCPAPTESSTSPDPVGFAPAPDPAADDTPVPDEEPPTADAADESASSTSAPDPAIAPVDPKTITGYAWIPSDQLATMTRKATGTVTAVTTDPPASGRRRWTVTLRDGAGTEHSWRVELPEVLGLVVRRGDAITVTAGIEGGGPNARGTLLIADDAGVPLLSIKQLPPSWTVDFGRRLSVDKGSTYTEAQHAVVVTDGTTRADVDPTWREITLGGAKFYAQAHAAKRKLRPGKPAPPDYVGSWIDLTLVRVP